MKIGCVIRPEEYALWADSGIEYVEFGGKVIAAMEDAEFDALCAQVQAGKLPCYAMNAYCDASLKIIGPDLDLERARLYARRLAERAARIGVKIAGVGSPASRNMPDGYAYEQAWADALAFFKVTGEEFAKHGICVCIEALSPSLCNFLNENEEAVRMAQETGLKNIGVIVDLYSMRLAGEDDPDLSAYADKITHMHTSDDDGSPASRSYLHPDAEPRHMRNMAHLNKIGYGGCLTVEIDMPYDAQRLQLSLDILKNA